MKYEKGYINIDFTPLFWLAGIGVVATLIGVPYFLYWLFSNFTVVSL